MIALNGCSSICFYCLRFGNAPLSAIHHRSKSLRDQVPATWIQLWLVWWLVNKSDVWCVTNDLMSLMYQRVESKSNYIASSTELSGYVFIVVNGILVGVIHKALGACHQAVQHLPLVGQWFVSSFFWCVSFWWMLPVCVCCTSTATSQSSLTWSLIHIAKQSIVQLRWEIQLFSYFFNFSVWWCMQRLSRSLSSSRHASSGMKPLKLCGWDVE